MVAGALIGAAGGIASSAIQAFGSNKSSAKAAAQQYQYNLALQKQAQEWNEYMYKNRYQMQVNDLEKAGINKLYGLGNASSVTSGMNSVGMPTYAEEENTKRKMVQEAIMQGIALTQNWSAKKAEINKINQETRTEYYNTQLKNLEVIEKQLRNKYLDKQLRGELQEQYSRTLKNLKEADLAYKKGNEVAQNTIELKRKNDWYKNNKQLGELAIASQELKDLGGSIISGISKGLGRRAKKFSAKRVKK